LHNKSDLIISLPYKFYLLFSKKAKKIIAKIFLPLMILISPSTIITLSYQTPFDQKEYIIQNEDAYDKFEKN
jgi:hypothetical protein|tara:strand:- start:205 stop:420 length:216 start_codon:yes stop_codon:yes gene_type:complete